MAQAPKIKFDMDHPVIKRGIQSAYDEGEQVGLDQGRLEIIDFLEEKYLKADDRPDRGSPEAQALLALAAEASEYFRGRVGTKTKGNKRK